MPSITRRAALVAGASLPLAGRGPLQPPAAVHVALALAVQLSVVDWPSVTVVGEAASETSGASGPSLSSSEPPSHPVTNNDAIKRVGDEGRAKGCSRDRIRGPFRSAG